MNKAPAREREDNYGKNKTITVFLFQETLLLINFKNSYSVGILSNCMLRFNHIL